MTYSLDTKPNPLADDPPVAATPGGGPNESPGLLVKPRNFVYEVVQGYFLQNGPKPKMFDFEHMLKRSFGMVDTSEERWENLKRSIAKLQSEAPQGVQYKVFFLARHGEGYHNHAVLQIGVEPWEAYWAFQYKHTTLPLTWGPDPELTENGISQALAIQSCWREQAPLGAPIREGEMKWYVSPLTRTAQTMLHSWGDMLAGQPEVWEDWREIYGSHTCDQRRSRSYLQERFPNFIIEDGFTEEDELWKPDMRETNEHQQIRGQRALDRIFGEGGAKETFISLTAHSENIRNLLAVLSHQAYPLATGEMIPVVVRATPTGAESNDDDHSTSDAESGGNLEPIVTNGTNGTDGTGVTASSAPRFDKNGH